MPTPNSSTCHAYAPFIWHIGKSFSVATYRCHCVRIVFWSFESRMVFGCDGSRASYCEWNEYKSICHAINENSINKFRSTTPTPNSPLVVTWFRMSNWKRRVSKSRRAIDELSPEIWPHTIRLIQFFSIFRWSFCAIGFNQMDFRPKFDFKLISLALRKSCHSFVLAPQEN